jgi:hypothetical protein
MSNLKTIKNICYFNSTCQKVNNYVHTKLLKHKEEYFVGLVIKCRKYTILKNKDKLNTNYVYKIMEIGKNDFKIKNEIDNIVLNVPVSIIKQNFKYPYSSFIDKT